MEEAVLEQPRAEEFKRAKSSGLSLTQVISHAREGVAAISGLPVDAVSKCERLPEGGWHLVVDLVESPARMGENDLIAVFDVSLDPEGALQSFERRGRYRREDGGLA